MLSIVRHLACGVLTWLLLLPTIALADPPRFVLRHNAVIGTAPDGRPVRFIYYHNDMLQHFQYLSMLALDAQEWPEAVEACEPGGDGTFRIFLKESPGGCSGGAFMPKAFDQQKGWDTALSWYVSPDGTFLHAYGESADIYDGSGWLTARTFRWTGSSYVLASEKRISVQERATRRVAEALQSADPHAVLNALEGMGNIGGRAGGLFSYPPEELLLPLWHFFRFRAGMGDQRGPAVLEEFLDKAVFAGRSGEADPTLENFLRYSMHIPGVREHISACALLLEQHGDKKKAEALRKALAEDD